METIAENHNWTKCRVPADIYNKTPAPKAGQWGQKHCRTQRSSHYVARMCLLECQRNCIYELSPIQLPKEVQNKGTPVDMWAHTWGNPWGLNHRQSYRQLRNVRSRKNTLSQGTAHQLVIQYHVALKTYTYKKTLYGLSIMYLYI